MTIRRRIVSIFALALLIVLGVLVAYIEAVIKPANMRTVKEQSTVLVESKASEVGMWIYRKVSEFRVLAQVPAFKSTDVRGIAPLIDNLTESFKQNGDTMETFAYGGINSLSGFNWVNAGAILDLIVYEDYVSVLNSGLEYTVGTPIRTPDNRTVILFYYPIQGYNGKYEGLLCSAIPTVRLDEIVDSMHVYGGKAWVMNRKGTLITSSPGYFYKRILGRDQLARLEGEGTAERSGYLSTRSPAGRDCTLFYAPVPYSRDWIFCSLVDNGEIFRSIDGMIRGLSIVCFLLLAVTVSLGILLARSVEAPIRLLQGQMDRVERGDLQAYFRGETKDEIYYLGNSYNSMLDEINRLIGRIYEEQAQKRKLELQVLQGQIKPHFLYNTLDNVKWMAKQGEVEDISRTVTALSTFFRVFLSEGEEEISLEEEFRHARSYLEIQQIRYGQLLSYGIELEEGIRGARIIKILTQPLVENAIYHGIKNRKRNGHIQLSAALRCGQVEIVVRDDGAGMDAATLESLRASLASGAATGHYGLRNIAERLRLAYGEEGGLSIESVEGEGTVARIHLPLREGGAKA
jgi:two-component system sensor histidine kinase YesM